MLSAGRRTAGQGRGRRAGCGLGERPHGGGRVEHVRMGVGVVVSEAGVSERAALERVGEAAERVAQRRCPRACGERPPPRTGSRRRRTSEPSPRERRPWRPSLQTPPGDHAPGESFGPYSGPKLWKATKLWEDVPKGFGTVNVHVDEKRSNGNLTLSNV